LNSKRYPLFLLALVLIGLGLGFWMAWQSPVDEEPALVETHRVTAEPIINFPQSEDPDYKWEMPGYPAGAIPGEVVLHFRTKKDYLAYLQALLGAGESPLNQIDELRAIRIPEAALRRVDPGKYGARASFSYRVERPLPPVEIDPVALARLSAYGLSPRSIAKGVPHGNGSGVLVGILDSGIEPHPQFDDLYIVNIDLVGGGMAGPGAAHGTSVASIISGREGIAPQSELFVVRVLDDQGLGNSYHVAEGIVQAVDMGVDLLNLSLGVYEDSFLLRQAIDYAHQRGVVLVAAAGNEGYAELPFPAAYDEVLAVTAVDARGNQAIFPNQSERIDFAAPGVGIFTAGEDSGTVSFSGTSAAAPFVTGTLASLMSGEAPLTAAEAVATLKRYLNDAGAPGVDPLYGAGVLDWDRLRERATPGILDVAIAGIHLSPDALPGTNMPVEITVQNRGTGWFNQAELEVLINQAEPMKFSVGTLGPGQITTRKVFAQVPATGSDAPLSLAARVLPADLNADVRLENNLKAVEYRPQSD